MDFMIVLARRGRLAQTFILIFISLFHIFITVLVKNLQLKLYSTQLISRFLDEKVVLKLQYSEVAY
jgi:hypothetical protein